MKIGDFVIYSNGTIGKIGKIASVDQFGNYRIIPLGNGNHVTRSKDRITSLDKELEKINIYRREK